MTDPMPEEELRTLLAERARDVAVPEPPLVDLMAAGARADRRRGRLLLGSVVAAVVLAIAAGAAVTEWPRQAGSPTPAKEPTQEPVRSLADLPEGEPSDIPFVSGRVVHLGDRSVPLPQAPARVLVSADDVVVQYGDRSLHHVDVETGQVHTVADKVETFALAGRHAVAYSRETTGTPVVVVRDLVDGSAVERAIPAIPSCCDNPFRIAGANEGLVIAGTDAAGQWVWAHRLDSLPPTWAHRIKGLGERQVVAMTASEVVTQGPEGYDVGRLDGDRLVVTERFDRVGPAFFGLSGVIVYASDAGELLARRAGDDVRLGLPALDFPIVHAEDATHIVLEIRAETSGLERDAQVRCDVRDGACEIAGWFDPDDVGVRPAEGPSGLFSPIQAAVRSFTAMVEDPTPTTAAAVPFAPTVRLGLGDDLRETDRDDLTTAEGWVRTPSSGSYAGQSGPIDLLAPLRRYLGKSADALLVGMALHPVCAGSPAPVVVALGDYRRTTLQPSDRSPASCLEWFAIDLYFDDDDQIVAVVLHQFEP